MESSKCFHLLSAVLLLCLASAVVGTSKQRPMPGGYQPIEDLKDRHVVKIAKFAVSQHNKNASDDLVFRKVLSGEKQVVAGINYRLIIAARDCGHGPAGHYKAVVYEKPWMKIRKLTSFEKV